MPRTALVVLCSLVVAGIAGCSSSAPSSVNSPSTNPTVLTVTAPPPPPSPSGSPAPEGTVFPSPTPYPRLSIPAGTPRCHTAQLDVAFVSSGAAAGNVEEVFEMRNKSVTSCWVYGFVGFQPLDAQGQPIPESMRWTTDSFFGTTDPPMRILLPPATAPLQWRGMNLYSSDGRGHAFFDIATNDVLCDINQRPVVTVEIWPPDEIQPLKIAATTSSYSTFSFCRDIDLSALQIQPG